MTGTDHETREDRPAGRRARRHDFALGWALSAAVHLVLLGAFLVVTAWWADEGEPGPRRRPVKVVVTDPKPALDAAAFPDVAAEPLTGALAVPRLKDSPVEKPVLALGEATRRTSKVERLIGIDVGAGGDLPAAMDGNWTDLAAGAEGTGRGGASFFGLEARGEEFVFVVDRSGSMKGARLAAAKAELLRSVRRLDRRSSFTTIFFSTHATPMPGKGLLRATEGNKRKHFAWVERIDAGGGTEPLGAVKRALALRPDAIWVLSDGIFDPRTIERIRRANPGQAVQIHTIAFYSRKGEEVLLRLAEQNRGRYRFVSPSDVGLGRKGT